MIQWRKGSQFKVSAEVAKKVTDELEAEGRLTPEELVRVSEAPDAPLHDEFEWDNDIAGQKWREHTARNMIASFVVIRDPVKEAEPVRAYFNIERNTHQYVSTVTIMKDEEKKNKLLDIAKRELRYFRVKYRALSELAGVFQAIDGVLSGDDIA